MRRRPLVVLVSVAALSLAAVQAPSASAEFHLVKIREVFPGPTAQPDAEYVEFQAYASGQNLVAGHSVTFHNSSGATVGTATFGSDVGDGRNQMTFTMATAAAESRFGILADEGLAPNLVDPAGGAVCWASLDCVSWGGFGGSLPSAAGSPAAPEGIPDGMALRRLLSPGCPTLLEEADDRDDSALDFSAVFPNPRPNSIVPSEQACGRGRAESRVPSAGAPDTVLGRRPSKRTRDRTPTFRFGSNEASANFQCKLDAKPYRPCSSPFTTRKLALRRHTFRVRAGSGGGIDPSPASCSFRVVRRPAIGR